MDELARIKKQNELILQAIGEGIYGMDRGGLATFVNPAASRMLGWEVDELIGQSMKNILFQQGNVDGDIFPRKNCPIHASATKGVLSHVEDAIFWRKDGSSFFVEYTSTAIYENNEIVGAVVAFSDISMRKKAEQQMQQALSEKKLILDAAGEGIYGIDMDGRATFVNPASIQMTGWTEEDIIGLTIHDKHHHSHANGSHYPRDNCPIYAALKDGEVHHVDNEVFWRKDGSCFPVEYTSTPIYKDKNSVGAVVVFKDISERKKTERALQLAYDEVEKMKQQLEAEVLYLQQEIRSTHDFKDIVGESNAIKQLMNQIELVAPTDASVLIIGESGTGKELIARAIHERSERNERPLIRVNCAAIPRELFESEFFGHVKGAFTGALKDRAGRFELANGGTIFLDEIGEIPLELQGKLLRVLQEGQFERVGGERTRTVDVRVIAATNRELKSEVDAKRFREDLFFRLNVFPIKAVALRDRVGDIPLLASHFIKQTSEKLGRPVPRLTQINVKQLQAYTWRGNVRELQNVIERAIIVSKNNRLSFDLPTSLNMAAVTENDTSHSDSSLELPYTEKERLQRDRDNINTALKLTNGRISGTDGAAKLLGIKPTTLASRLKTLGLND